jgi:hypothetical protein
LVVLLCAWSPLWSASAFAQADPILVVSGEAVPETLSEAVSDALGDVGSVMSPSGYSSKLRGREPDSEEALTKIAPQTGAQLVVVLQHARNKLKVELRSGHTGEAVGKTSLPGRGKRPKLAKPARKKLIAAAKRALEKIGPAPSKRATSDDDDLAEEAAPAQPVRAVTTPTKPTKPTRPAAPQVVQEPDEEEEQAGPFDLSAEEEPPRDAPAAAADEGTLFRLRAGLGLGTRSIVVPTQPGRMLGNRIDTSYVPSLDLGAALELSFVPSWRLRFGADYRTIFGLQASYLTAPGVMATSSLSSHSLIAGASLGHLSDGRDSFGVHVFLGWAWRTLSASEPSLPSASIQGAVLRPEIEIPIANRKLTIRLAPELILILVPSATLPMNDNALAKGVGYALGVEASVDLHINQTFGLSAQFRESRGTTPSGWGTNATENERYIALRLLVQL